jgi:hypothetical protein
VDGVYRARGPLPERGQRLALLLLAIFTLLDGKSSQNWSILSLELIDKSRRAGIKVFSDSLATEHEEVEESLKLMGRGIDVIQTNHPLRLLWAVELFKQQNP